LPGQRLTGRKDGAGNTFKATAKPVLIGTAVVGATTMIFSIMMGLTNGLRIIRRTSPCCMLRSFWVDHRRRDHLLVYGASIQAVTTGATRGGIIRRTSSGSVEKASVEDSKKWWKSAPSTRRGHVNIFLTASPTRPLLC